MICFHFFGFLFFKVLITKLRSANTVETRQYRKAAKALLVLIPLFGITYLVVLAGPNEGGVISHMFAIVRALLLSTQVCNDNNNNKDNVMKESLKLKFFFISLFSSLYNSFFFLFVVIARGFRFHYFIVF